MFRPRTLITVSLVAGLLAAPAVATAAYAGDEASARSFSTAADASALPVLHVGVRQAAVGDPIPVSIVGAAAGSVWDVSLIASDTLLGTVTVGDDGTGTALVSLPLGTDPGSVELEASSGGTEISTSVSSGGDVSTPGPESGAGVSPEAADADAVGVAPGLVIGGAAVGAGLLAGTAIAVSAHRRRRLAAR